MGIALFAVTVKDDYLGFNFGQFSITKKLGSAILFYSSKKKKKK
jgi:ribosomal protein S19